MKLKKMFALTLALVLAVSLAACGSTSYADTKAETMAAMQGAYDLSADSPAESEMAARTANGILTDSGEDTTTAPEGRKWIITMNVSAETEDLDALSEALDEKIAALGGFVENQSVYNGSAYGNYRRYRSASLTVRVPAEQAENFTEDLAGMANVVRKEKNLEDITLQYVDTESRKTALETEQARLLELLAQAETMSDLLEIEGRLTEVRADLERAASRLRLYDNQIDYATIYLDIEEVQEYTPVEPTFWERISGGFASSVKKLGESLKELFIGLIVSLPFIVVYGGIGAALVLLVRHLRKKHPRKPKKPQTPPQA